MSKVFLLHFECLFLLDFPQHLQSIQLQGRHLLPQVLARAAQHTHTFFTIERTESWRSSIDPALMVLCAASSICFVSAAFCRSNSSTCPPTASLSARE